MKFLNLSDFVKKIIIFLKNIYTSLILKIINNIATMEVIDNKYVNPSTNRVNLNLKCPKEISIENKFTKANTETIEKSKEKEEIDIDKEVEVPQEFNRLNEGAGDRPKKENTKSCTIYSDTSQSELGSYNKIFEDKELSISDFAKNFVQVDKEIRQEKRLKILLSTETNEKNENETIVKSNNNKQDQENEKRYATEKKKYSQSPKKKKYSQSPKKRNSKGENLNLILQRIKYLIFVVKILLI